MDFSLRGTGVDERGRGLQSPLLAALLLAALTVALYSPTLRNGFVNYDDPEYVTRNRVVQQGLRFAGLEWAFSTQNTTANWHPLTWISHMLDVNLYGMKAAGHHLTSVLLFALAVAILFLWLDTATGKTWRALSVAALFAVHPLNVESVAWAAERKAVLSLLFLLLTLWSYVSYAKRPSLRRYLLAVVLYALAALAKPTVITLPFALLLLDYWPLGRWGGAGMEPTARKNSFAALCREKIPFFLVSAALAWITFRLQRREGAVAHAMPLDWRLKNAVYSYAAYLVKLVWPSRLAVFYPHPENTLTWKVVASSAAVLVGISLLVCRYRGRKYLPMGWLWYLGMLVPVIGIVQAGRQGMADRYAPLGLLGLLIACVWLMADLTAEQGWKRVQVLTLLFLVLVPFSYVTRKQISYWQNSLTLFGHALDVTRNNGIAEENFGSALAEVGELELATQHLQNAIHLIPDLSTPHYDLAIILQHRNLPQEAEREYRMALARSSDPLELAQTHNNLGVLYLASDRSADARTEFSAAIQLNPEEVNSYLGRGMVEQQMANYDAAASDFSRAAALGPSPAAFFWLGRAYEGKEDYPRAQAAYLAALRLAPGMSEALTRLEELQKKKQAIP